MGNILCCCVQPRPAPKRDQAEPDSFFPSSMAYNASTPSCKDFKEISVVTPYSGGKKILVICTSKYLLQMANGKYFNTGHQASETFVALYHFDKCGFAFDVCTPDGKPVAIEEWTFPMATGYEDKLRSIQKKLQSQLDAPMKVSDVSTSLEPYAGIFMPGGHGPVIEQPKIAAIGVLLRAAHAMSLPTISLCHGPAAMLAAGIGGDFPYKGYKLCVFPDSADLSSPKFGYLPGYIKAEDFVEANLVKLGCIVQNKEMDDMTCVDRELVTGSSQQASHTTSVAAVKLLAEKYGFEVKF